MPQQPYIETLRGEEYALPMSAVYYIEGASARLDAYVRAHERLLQSIASEYDKHLVIIGLNEETLASYLNIRPDIQLTLPQGIHSPFSAISGKLFCRVDEFAIDDTYTFLTLDVSSLAEEAFMEAWRDYLLALCPPPMDELCETLCIHEEDLMPGETAHSELIPCEEMKELGSPAPEPFFARWKKSKPGRGKSARKELKSEGGAVTRQEFIDELQQRLNALSEEGMNIFLQTLGSDFLKTIEGLAPKPLSTLRIDEKYRILLPDYDLEIKMNALWKALYILFLRHEEGIVLKDIGDYRDELGTIYKLFGTGEYERIEATLDDVTTPGSDNLRQYLSKINKAFTGVLAVDLAKHYCISGQRGAAYRVLLSRDRIEWPKSLSETA